MVNYGTEKLKISFDETKTNPKDLSKKIESLGYSLFIPEEAIKHDNHAHHEGMDMSEEDHSMHL